MKKRLQIHMLTVQHEGGVSANATNTGFNSSKLSQKSESCKMTAGYGQLRQGPVTNLSTKEHPARHLTRDLSNESPSNYACHKETNAAQVAAPLNLDQKHMTLDSFKSVKKEATLRTYLSD